MLERRAYAREEYMDIYIHSDNVSLRSWTMKDAQALSIIGNNDEVEANMNDGFPKPFTVEKAREFIKNARKSNDLFLAIEKSNKIVGSIGAFFNTHDKTSAVIAYFIGKDYWNQGYASSAIKGLIEYLVKEKGIKTVSAEPFERNHRSRKVLEKNGFKLIKIIENGTKKNNIEINTCKYEYRIVF